MRQHAASDARLKVEADDRNGLRHGPAMRDEFILRRMTHRAKAEQTCVIAESANQCRFGNGLLRFAANTCDANERLRVFRTSWSANFSVARTSSGFRSARRTVRTTLLRGSIHLFFCQGEHRLEQPDPRIADGELCRMNAYRESADTSGDVVAAEGTLPAFVESA